jgi:hypothetical protein
MTTVYRFSHLCCGGRHLLGRCAYKRHLMRSSTSNVLLVIPSGIRRVVLTTPSRAIAHNRRREPILPLDLGWARYVVPAGCLDVVQGWR